MAKPRCLSNDSSQWNDTDGDGFGDEPNGVDADDCVKLLGIQQWGSWMHRCRRRWLGRFEDDLPDTPSQWQDSTVDTEIIQMELILMDALLKLEHPTSTSTDVPTTTVMVGQVKLMYFLRPNTMDGYR